PEQFAREMGQQEKKEDSCLKNENSAALLVMVVFVVPGPEEYLCAVVSDRAEAAPVFEQRQCAGVKHDEICKERSILIAIGVKQNGRQQSANQRHDRDRRRVVNERERACFGDQDCEESKSRLLSDEMVIAERGVSGKVKQHDAAGGQDLRKDAPASPPVSVTGERHRDAERDADRDSAQLADPAIVECVLQKERGGEENQHDRDPANSATPDQRFELESVERRRWTRHTRWRRRWWWLKYRLR